MNNLQPTHPTWTEYENAAEWCAKRGIKGNCGDPLPELISSTCVSLINDDPEAFASRVNDFAYAIVMEKLSA